MTQPSIAILLCTYNSERYLPELLESLFAQSCQDFRICVHDDGSSDHTRQLIEAAAQRFPRIELLNDPCPGRKAMNSFFWLLEQVESRYYMFCDHDDVWLPDKVAKTLAKMQACEAACLGKAVVINTDLRVVNQALETIHPSFWRYNKIDRSLLNTFDYLTVCNAFTGCTMMINQAAKTLSFPVSPKAMMHDKWIALQVAANGGCLDYVDEATILYRQHGDNEIGAMKVGWRYYLKKLVSLRAAYQLARDTLEMSRAIRPYSWVRFLRFKLCYYVRRFRH